MDVVDFDAFRAAPVATDPFPHILLERFIRAEALPAVFAALPPMKGRGSFPIEALKLGGPAQDAIAALQGDEFRNIVATKFGLDLTGAPNMVTLRGNSGPQDGQIHTDSSAKRVTILLYLNPGTDNWARQEGCLRLLRGPENLEDYAAEVPPVNGTLLVFPNTPASWHGHKPFTGQRYVVQMNYMTTSTKAKTEMRRHHLSAFIKRLTRAA
jgi:SM-20-related protein